MSRVGKFLIARPTLNIGFFTKSVIWIYAEEAAGTSGICLNKPGLFCLRDLANQIGQDYPQGIDPVYIGGPVNERSVNLVHTDDFVSSNTLHTGTGIDISSDTLMIEKLVSGNTPNYYRLAAGSSAWAPGQLDFEISKNYWLIADLRCETVFNTTGEEQWELAIKQVGQQLAQRFF